MSKLQLEQLDTTPLIEWEAPAAPMDAPGSGSVEAQPADPDEELEEAIVVQPIDDLNEEFEVVQGQGEIAEGDTLTQQQIDALRETGQAVVEQSVLEATYHVHAEVSPKGVPLTKQHRIPVNAKSETEAKTKARAHAKERGWQIHNIHKVTLAEDDNTMFKLSSNLTEDDLSFIIDNITIEELEQLDELSTETLKAYVKKAKPEYEDAWLQMKNKLAQKRGRGVDRAEEKLRKKKLVHEEQIELGELEDQNQGPTRFSEITAPERLEEKAGYSAKAAEEGKDLGKKGKNFDKIASKAAKKYGSKEAGERVAGAILAKLRNESAEPLTEEETGVLSEAMGIKVHHYDDFKSRVQEFADHTTSHGKVKYRHEVVGDHSSPTGKKWHQTVATVEDRAGNNYIRGVFNHKHGKESPHGHGWTSDPYGDH